MLEQAAAVRVMVLDPGRQGLQTSHEPPVLCVTLGQKFEFRALDRVEQFVHLREEFFNAQTARLDEFFRIHFFGRHFVKALDDDLHGPLKDLGFSFDVDVVAVFEELVNVFVGVPEPGGQGPRFV